MIITSIDNKKIKELCKLYDKKYRKDSDLFIVEGEHLVTEANKHGLLEEVYSLNPVDYDNVTLVSEAVMKKITSLTSIPSMIGVCKKVKEKELGDRILILDNIQDPGNLGTIIRSAVAFSIDTIVLSCDTVDLYNPKVIRATQGMIFTSNIIVRDLIPFVKTLNDYKKYTTNVVCGTELKSVEKNNKYAIIMGNEGQGVKEDLAKLCDEAIYINMSPLCESLNVAIATSIILYEFSK